MGNCWGTEEANKKGSTGNNGSHDSMHQGIVRERNLDVYEKYEEVEVLGQGSMGHVAKVQVKEGQEGGSAFNPKKKGGFALKHVNRVQKSTSNLSERRSTKVDYALKSILLDRVSQQFLDELSNEIGILKTMVCSACRIYVVRSGVGIMVDTSKYSSDTLDPFVCLFRTTPTLSRPTKYTKTRDKSILSWNSAMVGICIRGFPTRKSNRG
jgi:hypothetical protein